MSPNKLTIDVISDLICPWCYVGLVSLSKALDVLQHQLNVEINWHGYELHYPESAPPSEQVYEKIQASLQSTELSDLASQLGLPPLIYADFKIFSTRPAHRLLAHASTQTNPIPLALKIFQEVFYWQRDISNLSLLTDIALHCGFDAEFIAHQLDTAAADTVIEKSRHHWQQDGITSVPAFVINQKYVVHGAQSETRWLRALKRLSFQPRAIAQASTAN